MAVNKPARKFRQRRFKTTKWKPSEFALSAILLAPFLIYMLFRPFTVGHDARYFQYIILPPFCIGVVVFCLWKRKEILSLFKDKSKGIVEQLLKVVAFLFYTLIGMFMGFFILGVPAMAVWDYCNVQAANKNPVEVIVCPVTQFYFGRGCNISFTFNGHHEQIDKTYRSLKQYKDENPENYNVVLTCREGLWNYYVVEDWDVVKKN